MTWLDTSLDGRLVQFPRSVARMREPQCEFAVVGEKNQSLRVMIEPAHGIKIAPFPRQKISKDSTFLGIAPRRDVAFRFVESDVKLAPRFDWTPIDQDTVLC